MLIPKIQEYFVSNLNDKYIESYIKFLNNKNIKYYLLLGVSNLECKEYYDYYIIQINPNVTFPETTAKLYDVCYEINYGSLNIPPYPIFSDAFNWAQQNKYRLYLEYLEEDY